MTRRRSGTSTRSVCSVSVSMNALRGACCVQPPRIRPSPLPFPSRKVSVAKRRSHFTIEKHNSKEIQMKCDVPSFNKPWKISLENHYQTPDTLESAARHATGSKEAWQRFSSNLLDFTKQRVEQMDQTGIELAILSLAPGIEEIYDKERTCISSRWGVTSSSLGGQTKNPYELSRTPGGSSGGTGAALAANFATMGTGLDTVNSIRSPSSANSLLGIRPTRGLISRAGVIPVSFTQDAAGPLARTVADATVMLDVMAGYDPDDPVTALGIGRIPATYTVSLDRNGLKGARIGVLRTLFGSGPDHQEVNRVTD